VDESGCSRYYSREYGYSRRGVKIEDVRRGRKFGRVNVIAAYCCGKTLAPKTYKHNTNAAFFEDWFEFDLLSVVPCGWTIIMDNASFHRKKALREIASKYGVEILFLPPYSPDFNPIEKFWANMKKWLAKNVSFFATLSLAIYAYCVRFLC
jgi:transposase